MKKLIIPIGTALLSVGLFAPAHAYTSFTITDVDGDWANSVPSVSISNDQDFAVAGDGRLSTARWGVSTGSGQSGYDFVSDATPFTVLSDGTPFAFGTFTHQNWPVYPPSLESIDLDLSGTISGFGTVTTTVKFGHNETTNNWTPESNPLNNDIVTITNPVVNAEITDGLTTYYFNMVGFSTNGGTTITPGFSTVEGQANTAVLYGRITEEKLPPVPEPASAALIGVGATLAGLIRSRKKLQINNRPI